MGGFLLTLINMAVVLLVLGALALLIRAIHRIVTALGERGQNEPPKRAVLVVSSHSEAEEGEVFLPLDIEPAKRAAILAAISVYLGKPETAMFLRETKDSGAWGRLSRRHWGFSGAYRPGQPARDRQVLGNSRP